MQYRTEINLSAMNGMRDVYFPIYSSLKIECVVDQVDLYCILRDGTGEHK